MNNWRNVRGDVIVKYEKTTVYVQTGDILQSKEGFFFQSPVTENYYTAKKVKVLGNGHIEVIGEKEEVIVEKGGK